MWHAVANTALGHASYVVGDLDTALGVLPKSAYNETTPAQVRVLALGVLALAEAELGHYDRSRRSAFEAMQVVEARSLQALPPSPMNQETALRVAAINQHRRLCDTDGLVCRSVPGRSSRSVAGGGRTATRRCGTWVRT